MDPAVETVRQSLMAQDEAASALITYIFSGAFTSIRDCLRAYIHSSLDALIRQQGIDEYKTRFLQRVTDFVSGGMHNTPAIVEDIPIVTVHSDMGPHNVILSPTTPTDIMAIINWEFVASAPFCLASPHH